MNSTDALPPPPPEAGDKGVRGDSALTVVLGPLDPLSPPLLRAGDKEVGVGKACF